MFVYVRYIALICVLLGSIAAGVMGYIFASKAREAIDNDRYQDHITIAQTVGSGLWRRYFPLTPQMVMTTAGPMAIPVDASKFPAEATQFLKQYDAARITILAFRGGQAVRLATSADTQWKDTSGKPIELIELGAVAKGYSAKRAIDAVSASGKKVRLVQSLIPVPRATKEGEQVKSCITTYRAGICTPEIFIETISEEDASYQMITLYKWIFTGAASGLFLLIVTVVLVTISRAEGIITKQHEVNLELTAAASAAEAQSRDKSMFLASISHELRTPLNAIIGFSEIIKDEGRNGLIKQHQEYIDDIHASGKHLLALINDILDYSKAEAGKLQIEYSEADLLKLVRNSMRMVLLVENLPKMPIVITTDIKKLRQVLLNLLSNAVKFTPQGGEVRVSAWEDVATKDIIIEVKDTGIGIAPKDISRVMMPFVQVDSALSRRFEGTGLGLPLSKKFIESMGGQFYIESEVNKGTTITARLPMKPENLPSSAPAPQGSKSDVPQA
jgi:two-component system, cell cycle sensor histidine kinase PleC